MNQQEMTLEQYCAQLPSFHLVNKQLTKKDQRIKELEAAIQRHIELGENMESWCQGAAEQYYMHSTEEFKRLLETE